MENNMNINVPKNMQFTRPQRELVKKLATQYQDIEEAYKEFKKSYPWYKWRKFFYIEVDKLLKTNFFDSYVPLNRVGRPKNAGTKRKSRISITAEEFREMYISVLKGNKTILEVMKDAGYSSQSCFYYYRDKYKDQIPHSIKYLEEEIKTEIIQDSNEINIESTENVQKEVEDKVFSNDSIKEVELVLNKKYKALDCYLEREYNIDDYINIFDLLLYLAKNHENIRSKSLNQSDIDEHYRRDIEHAIELEEERDYSQLDRLHILGIKRRKSKETYEDMSLLSGYLNIVNIRELEKVLKLLKDKKEQREKEKYIPRVDYTMVKKYDWCTSGTLSSKVINTPLTTSELKKTKVVLPTYRIKVEIWGYRGEPFYNEYLDFQVNSESQAREKAETYMKKRLNQERIKTNFFIMDIYKLP